MTLRPEPYSPEVGGALASVLELLASRPLTAWITFDLVEFTANVVMFAPLGALVLLWGGRWWAAALLGLAASGAIETIQLLFLDARVADVRDLVANTLGALIGALLTAAVRAGTRRSHSARGALTDTP